MSGNVDFMLMFIENYLIDSINRDKAKEILKFFAETDIVTSERLKEATQKVQMLREIGETKLVKQLENYYS